MSKIALYLLGQPRLEYSGLPVAMNTRKALALLAYLAVTDQSYSRESLDVLLWPESSPKKARTALRTTLSVLRKALNREWLISKDNSIGLADDADVWVDVVQFRQLVSLSNKGSRETHIQNLSQAVDLCQSRFMVGFSLRDSPNFDEWQFFEAEALQHELAIALEQLIVCLKATENYEAAIQYARRWLNLDSLHEPAHCQLMELYGRTNQHSAAVRQYQECVRLLKEGLGVPPQAETTALYQRLLGRSNPSVIESSIKSTAPIPQPHSQLGHNLPAQMSPFIGRKTELTELARLFASPEARLLTIVGPGGMGKTRFALEAAKTQIEYHQHGVYFVPLNIVTDPKMIHLTIADAVQFSFQSDERSPKQQLIDYFRAKQTLLILDNFEHLLNDTALITTILQAAPAVRIWVTSRERLNLSSEIIFTLNGLNVSDIGLDEEVNNEAITLFLQSARQGQPFFKPQGADWNSIRQICHLVGGLPLGILLAAGWATFLSPQETVAEISQSLDILETELRDIPERQRSLRIVCEQTWTRLSKTEQVIFAQLSVFQGGFTRQAAQIITGASLKTLAGLVSKSLLQQTDIGRYDLHMFLHQFSSERLEALPQLKVHTQHNHSRYFARFLQAHEAALSGENQRTVLAEIGEEIGNVHLAWQWFIAQEGSQAIDQMLPGLYRFYWMQSRFTDGRQAFAQAAYHLQINLAHSETLLLSRVLARQGVFETYLSNFDLGQTLLEKSLAIAHRCKSQYDIAFALNRLAGLAMMQLQPIEARALAQEALNISQTLHDKEEILWALEHIAGSLCNTSASHYQEAKRFNEEGLKLSRTYKDLNSTANFLDQLGWLAFVMEDYPESKRYYEESVAIFSASNNLYRGQLALGGLVHLAWVRGGQGLREAGILCQKKLAFCQDIGNTFSSISTLTLYSLILNDQKAHGDAKTWATEGLSLAEKSGINDIRLQPNLYSSLGMAEYGLGNFSEARQHLSEALNLQPDNLRAIIHGAYLLVAEKAPPLIEQGEADFNDTMQVYALQLLMMTLHQPTIGQIEKNLVTPLLTQLKANLPPDTILAAQRKAQQLNLEITVAKLLKILTPLS